MIYCGDAIDILKTFKEESIDCCVSDIPYKITTGGCPIIKREHSYRGILNRYYTEDRLKNKWLKQDDIDSCVTLIRKGRFFDSVPDFAEWLPELYRVMKNRTHIYLMINGRNLKDLQQKAENAGFKFQNLLVWVKNNATPNKFYMNNAEFILMLRKGGERYINDLGCKNVFTYINKTGNKLHPNEKPVALMKDFILNSTNEGETVIDMFMGSGTTGVACKEINRKFIGIEIEQKYFDIAKKRIENTFIERKQSNQLSML